MQILSDPTVNSAAHKIRTTLRSLVFTMARVNERIHNASSVEQLHCITIAGRGKNQKNGLRKCSEAKTKSLFFLPIMDMFSVIKWYK